MRKTWPRIGACRIVIAVVSVGLVLCGVELVRYRGKYAQAMLRYHAARFNQANSSPDRKLGAPERRRYVQRVSYYSWMASKWRAAADLPILPFTDDPPEPE